MSEKCQKPARIHFPEGPLKVRALQPACQQLALLSTIQHVKVLDHNSQSAKYPPPEFGLWKKKLVHIFTSFCCFSAHSIFILLFLVTRSTLEKSTQTICQAQASGSYSVHMGQARAMDNHLHHLPQSANIRMLLSTKIGWKGQRKMHTLYTLCNLLGFFLPRTVSHFAVSGFHANSN